MSDSVSETPADGDRRAPVDFLGAGTSAILRHDTGAAVRGTPARHGDGETTGGVEGMPEWEIRDAAHRETSLTLEALRTEGLRMTPSTMVARPEFAHGTPDSRGETVTFGPDA